MIRWRLRPTVAPDAGRFSREAGLSPTAARVLGARGVATAREAREFFSPSLDSCPDPFRLRGMERAVEVLVAAARAGHRIVVFGDYDVDGVTAVAQLRAVFRVLGTDAVPFLPHRVRDGYGLKPETFRKVLEMHRPRALVTVDCGITAADAVAEASRAGVAVVVTDHHLPPDVLPAGAAVVNPRQPGCPYPFKELAGAGVAFKIAQAIIRREGLSLSERSLVKIAALGTIADIVPLVSENRAIVAEGLAGLASARSPGLRALLAESGVVGRAPSAEEVAFRVGPRLNAAGRLDTADLALAVLEERDPVRAQQMAQELSSRNAERQKHERRVVEEARDQLRARGDPASEPVLVAADRSWPRGVLGIAASRLAREFHRPALLFAIDGERAVGSGRSVPGVSLHGILSELRDRFLEFGGHDQACGGTVPAADFEAFRKEARELFGQRVGPDQREPVAEVDAELELSGADETLLAELERFEPHGAGNPRPVFLGRGIRTVGPLRALGDRGRRGSLEGNACRVQTAIAWGAVGAEWEAARARAYDILYSLRRDRYNGRPEIEIVGFAKEALP
jgi:single-stranded-DNA-specific exonuclease